MNIKKDISKNDMYEAVKTLVDLEDSTPHIHLHQHKLFNLYSIAFQYMLYKSTKRPGAYIVRIEDSHFADKICRRAKDLSSRKFLQAMLLPRKLKYQKSIFYLDFFHIASWNLTNDIPHEKVQGAIIVKNTSSKPMSEALITPEAHDEEDEKIKDEKEYEKELFVHDLPQDYYYSSLKEFVPKTIVIAYEKEFEDVHKISYNFIKRDKEKTLSGVTISKDLDWDSFNEED